MPDMTVCVSELGFAAIQVIQLLKDICVHYLSIYFWKPFDLLLYLNNFTGSTRFSHLKDARFYISSSMALAIYKWKARLSSVEKRCSHWNR